MRARRLALSCLLALACLPLPAAAARRAPKEAPKLVRVPQDAHDIQSAIKAVAAGGVIELSAGTYASLPRGFLISGANVRKGFTIQAAAGAAVTIDGGGSRQLLRYENATATRGKLVTFTGIAFRNGVSTLEGYAGGVTVIGGEVKFVRCVFENNSANGRTSGGGAVRVSGGSLVSFEGSALRGNSSPRRGGALEIVRSTVSITGGELSGNRTDLPGHVSTSSGGAIYLFGGDLQISDARLTGNHAGWTGGAIYAFGTWGDPAAAPGARIQINRSTFQDNLAAAANGAPPGPTSGGAIHVEDEVSLLVVGSVFLNNAADFGGAIDSYRAAVDVRGSRFQGNRSPATPGGAGAGGAILETSADFADSSTGSGAINRRAASLTVSDTLFQSGVAPTGGCVSANGDVSRAYGLNGVSAAGSLDDNRARVTLQRVAFADCDARLTGSNGSGTGGAVQADLAALTVTDSLVFDSDAPNGGGGGFAVTRESAASIARTTFVHDTAQRWGGALMLLGSSVQVADSGFFSNTVVEASRGSAIYSIPMLAQGSIPARNVDGTVSNSTFADNGAVAVWDVDPASGPTNEMRYDGNRFYSPSATFVYANSLAKPGGMTATELNFLVVDRGFRGRTTKSNGGNQRLTSAPATGTVLAVPPYLGAGAPGERTSFLAYGWSGHSASLGGQSLPSGAGLLAVSVAGDYPLAVDGATVATARLGAAARARRP
jgi:hypothetical protein